jgi:tetratricopeptide (TPR) repeat protein
VADDLAELLAAGERAAFHGRPANGVTALEQAFAIAHEQGRSTEATAAAWLLGVSLAAAGRFGSALTVLEPVAGQAGAGDASAERRLFAALAAATIASVRRQLGQHDLARQADDQALAYSEGLGEAGFDGLLGLAADAVGLVDLAAAQQRFAQAEALVEQRADWWRQRVRLNWVRAEIALLEGDPAAAIAAATAAVQRAEASGAPRHVAKGLLFLGVAQVQAGELDEAESTLRRAAMLADSLGTLPLLWPSRAVLGALLEEKDPGGSAKALSSARSALIAIADDLPEDLRTVWLDRPDVAALLGG